jgi:hypothetical protein
MFEEDAALVAEQKQRLEAQLIFPVEEQEIKGNITSRCGAPSMPALRAAKSERPL